MIVHENFGIPVKYVWGDQSYLSDFELEEFKEEGIDEVWYWYVAGSYEGDGWLLARKGDFYDISYLSHCSCYGPTENIEVPCEFSLKTLWDLCSEEVKKDTHELFKAAGLKI